MAVTPPLTENGAGLFSRCRAVRTVDVCVVPELLFTGVTKLVVAEGPETAPIIPGVVIQARPGIAQRRQRLC